MHSQASSHLKSIVARNVRLARDEIGWTQRKLAGALGLDTQSVHRWERGSSLPSPENLTALAKATKRDPGWFYVDRRTA